MAAENSLKNISKMPLSFSCKLISYIQIFPEAAIFHFIFNYFCLNGISYFRKRSNGMMINQRSFLERQLLKINLWQCLFFLNVWIAKVEESIRNQAFKFKQIHRDSFAEINLRHHFSSRKINYHLIWVSSQKGLSLDFKLTKEMGRILFNDNERIVDRISIGILQAKIKIPADFLHRPI